MDSSRWIHGYAANNNGGGGISGYTARCISNVSYVHIEYPISASTDAKLLGCYTVLVQYKFCGMDAHDRTAHLIDYVWS
jgi:hypothetical protein